MNIFEVATRSKMRFSYKGSITVEDLWDLSVEALDSIYKSLKAEQKKANEESLLSTKTTQDKELEVKIEIVRHIFGVKLEEKEARVKAKEKKETKQKLMAILAEKQETELKGKSAEEIQAMIDQLGE